jgi:hypothetical protein
MAYLEGMPLACTGDEEPWLNEPGDCAGERVGEEERGSDGAGVRGDWVSRRRERRGLLDDMAARCALPAGVRVEAALDFSTSTSQTRRPFVLRAVAHASLWFVCTFLVLQHAGVVLPLKHSVGSAPGWQPTRALPGRHSETKAQLTRGK